MDYDANISEAHREGLQEGRQEGRQEERLAVAANALRKRMSHEDIAELTGLSLEEINHIAADILQ
jgi:predicted transposase/invertase (TIGR01784 family)